MATVTERLPHRSVFCQILFLKCISRDLFTCWHSESAECVEQLTPRLLQVTTMQVNAPGAEAVKSKKEEADLTVYADDLAGVDEDDEDENL